MDHAVTETVTKRPYKKRAPKTGKKRPKAKFTSSKLEIQVGPLREQVLHGYMLVVDPSSGSAGSQPGFAAFRNGKAVDWGVINLPVDDLNRRLHYLTNTLREEFIKPDVLVVEKINAVMSAQPYSSRSMVSLQRAVGAVMSVWDVPLIEISVMTWQSRLPPYYVKSDDNDALAMGISCVQVAHEAAGLPAPDFDSFGEEVMGKLTKPTGVVHAPRRR
jgi:hypothetical protein